MQNSNSAVSVISDSQRRCEVQSLGKWIGTADGIGNNCLIHSILQALALELRLVRPDVLNECDHALSLCMDCRRALVALPSSDVRRPAVRNDDGSICTEATDAEHDAAHLQVHIHSSFVVNFFLSNAGMAGHVLEQPVRIRESVICREVLPTRR